MHDDDGNNREKNLKIISRAFRLKMKYDDALIHVAKSVWHT